MIDLHIFQWRMIIFQRHRTIAQDSYPSIECFEHKLLVQMRYSNITRKSQVHIHLRYQPDHL